MDQTEGISIVENEAVADTGIFDDLKPPPLYYSPNTVYVFSLLFSVFFGAILLVVNFVHTQGRRGIWQVLLLSIVFVAAEIWVYLFFDNQGSPLFFFNIAGAFLLKNVVWNEYIGRDVPYRSRSVWIPAIVGIALAAGAYYLIFIPGWW